MLRRLGFAVAVVSVFLFIPLASTWGANRAGDANNDHVQDMADAVLVQSFLYNPSLWTQASPLALVSGNHVNDVKDLLLVAQVATGARTGVVPDSGPLVLSTPAGATLASGSPAIPVDFTATGSWGPGGGVLVDGMDSLVFEILKGAAVQSTLSSPGAAIASGGASVLLNPLNPSAPDDTVTVRLSLTVHDSDGNPVETVTAQTAFTVTAPICGDGLVNDPGEQCDDGNLANGDGCDGTCMTEPGCGFSISSSAFVDISGSGIDSGIIGDDNAGTAPIGFSFSYYGNVYSQVSVETNGYLAFDGYSGHFFNRPIPNPSFPNNLLAAFWDDLYVDGSTGRIFYQTIGTPGSRTFIVQWDHIYFCCSPGADLNFQIVLHEGSNIVEYRYGSMSEPGASATVGHEMSGGLSGQEYSFNTPFWISGLSLTTHPDSCFGVCGDGFSGVGEACDDGDSSDCTAACNAICTGPALAHCGNGIVDCGEVCDDGDTDPCTATCNAGCTGPAGAGVCGNGQMDCSEECDDGNGMDGDGCQANCLRGVCGDGISDMETVPLEATLEWVSMSCGLPATIKVDVNGQTLFDASMAGPSCDCASFVQSVSTTDPGLLSAFSQGANSIRLRLNPQASSNFLAWALLTVTTAAGPQTMMLYDGGYPAGAYARDTFVCYFAYVSFMDSTASHFLDSSEACDDGPDNGTCGYCGATCSGPATPVCGDGYLGCGEACDDGDQDNCTVACNAACTGPAAPPACGNGALDCGEECDDGNLVPGDGCQATCQLPMCGDGVVDGQGALPLSVVVEWLALQCGTGADIEFEVNGSVLLDQAAGGSGCGCASVAQSVIITDPALLQAFLNGANTLDFRLNPLGTGVDLGWAFATINSSLGSQTVVLYDGYNLPAALARESNMCGFAYTSYLDQSYSVSVALDPEACDDGPAEGPGLCTNDCRGVQICGDGLASGTEACDDGFTTACGLCNDLCDAPGTGAYCGDGALCTDSEQCDDGNSDSCDGCHADCTVNPGNVCGDSVVCGAEECDPPAGGPSPAPLAPLAAPPVASLLDAETEAAVAASPDGADVIVALAPNPAFGRARAMPARMREARRRADEVLATVPANELALRERFQTFSGFVGRLRPQGLARLRNNPHVLSIRLDSPVAANLSRSIPLIEADTAHATGAKGFGSTVAVIDTGVSVSHPALGGRVVAEQCYCSNFCCPNGLQTQSGPGAADDDYGHGTHVAGIVASANATYTGVAPEANIVSLKVLSASGNGFMSDVWLALDWVAANQAAYNIRAANMSLGGGNFIGVCDASDPAGALSAQSAKSAGVFLAAASGNDALLSRIGRPACFSAVAAVGAVYSDDFGTRYFSSCTDTTTAADQVTCFSNTSSELDLLAPGSVIASTIPAGLFLGMSGTSMAAPHVAGLAAMLATSNPALTPDQMLDIMKVTGIPVPDTRTFTGAVYPRINAWQALQLAAPVGGVCQADCTMACNLGYQKVGTDCVPDCGDNSAVPGEVCDGTDLGLCPNDGFWGCSAACDGCVLLCGNGALDPGENCDDGNTAACDGCSADCQSVDGVCGDGVTDCSEACDDGPFNGQCGFCAINCMAPTNVCGDGNILCGEFCDDGYADACGACNDDCSGPGAGPGICGDAVTCPEAGETCDSGGLNGVCGQCNVTCTGPYQPVCGDSVAECQETCDDGNTAYGDGCAGFCQTEIAPAGLLNTTWGIDDILLDGNIVQPPDAGPLLQSLIPAGYIMPFGFTVTGTPPGQLTMIGAILTSGNLQNFNIESIPIPPVDFSENPRFVIQIADFRTVVLGIQIRLRDLRIEMEFIPDLSGIRNGVAEALLDPRPLEGFIGINLCAFVPWCDANGYVPVRIEDLYGPRYPGLVIVQNPPVTCGNGVINGGEFCDDGFNSACGACNVFCSGPGVAAYTCGDGVYCPEVGETCDDGGENGTCTFCDSICAGPFNICGDNVVRCGEACDDGNTVGGDGCNPTCTGP